MFWILFWYWFVKLTAVSGELLTFNSWEYKPPAAKDIPQDFRVTLLKNVRNPTGMLSSKSKTNEMKKELLSFIFPATGEPAICMSVSVFFAIRDALNSARKDSEINGWWQFGDNVLLKLFSNQWNIFRWPCNCGKDLFAQWSFNWSIYTLKILKLPFNIIILWRLTLYFNILTSWYSLFLSPAKSIDVAETVWQMLLFVWIISWKLVYLAGWLFIKISLFNNIKYPSPIKVIMGI